METSDDGPKWQPHFFLGDSPSTNHQPLHLKQSLVFHPRKPTAKSKSSSQTPNWALTKFDRKEPIQKPQKKAFGQERKFELPIKDEFKEDFIKSEVDDGVFHTIFLPLPSDSSEYTDLKNTDNLDRESFKSQDLLPGLKQSRTRKPKCLKPKAEGTILDECSGNIKRKQTNPRRKKCHDDELEEKTVKFLKQAKKLRNPKHSAIKSEDDTESGCLDVPEEFERMSCKDRIEWFFKAYDRINQILSAQIRRGSRPTCQLEDCRKPGMESFQKKPVRSTLDAHFYSHLGKPLFRCTLCDVILYGSPHWHSLHGKQGLTSAIKDGMVEDFREKYSLELIDLLGKCFPAQFRLHYEAQTHNIQHITRRIHPVKKGRKRKNPSTRKRRAVPIPNSENDVEIDTLINRLL